MNVKALSDFLNSDLGEKVGINIGESFSELVKILTKGLTYEEKEQLLEEFKIIFINDLKEEICKEFQNISEKKFIEQR